MSSPVVSPFDDLAGTGTSATTGAQTGTAKPAGSSTAVASPFDDIANSNPAVTGPDKEEQEFLKANPTYKYFPADPKFPHRPEGIYQTGPGNEWRNNPDYAQAPEDLHLAANTAKAAATSAALVGGGAAMASAIPSVIPSTIAGLKAIGSWAKENPVHAYVLYNTLKEFVPGFKKAAGIVHDAPTE